jgi:hypothetical protein
MSAARQRKRTMSKSHRRLLEKVIVQLERVKELANDPRTPETKIDELRTILENYTYRRPPFAAHARKPLR